MREIWAGDSETDPFKYGRVPQPFIWGMYNGSEYHEFKTPAEVAAFCREREGICYMHNGGKFDYHFLIQYAEAYDSVLVINGRIAKWRLGGMEMRDSMNILPVPLSAYQKEEIDYSIFEADQRDKPANREKIRAYLKSDCVNLWDMVTAFIDRYGMHLTQASASMKLWRKGAGVELPDSGPVFFDRFKPFYFGGRVQAFETGVKRERFQMADVNSAYPYAMLSRHPFGTVFSSARRDRRKIIGRDFYIVHGVSKGAFPFRDDLKLEFPADRTARTYYVTGHELLAALETGALAKGWDMLERIHFEDAISFEDYILYHYNLRREAKQQGDKAGALFSKLLMNSLYGKFGADPRRYANHIIVPAVETPVDSPQYPLAGMVGPWALVEDQDSPVNSRFYNVATAASITGFQRAHLFRQIVKCDGPLYCDTDAVAARDLGDIDLSDKLGAWSMEGEFNRWAIAGRKLYAFFGEDGAVKFASKGAKLYPSEIEAVARGAVVEYEPAVPTFSVLKAPSFVERRIRLTQ